MCTQVLVAAIQSAEGKGLAVGDAESAALSAVATGHTRVDAEPSGTQGSKVIFPPGCPAASSRSASGARSSGKLGPSRTSR